MFGRIRLKAYAKINLCLDIIGVRKDGYHLLESVMQSIDLYDTVCISKCKTAGVTVSCENASIPQEKNTAYKAALAFLKASRKRLCSNKLLEERFHWLDLS